MGRRDSKEKKRKRPETPEQEDEEYEEEEEEEEEEPSEHPPKKSSGKHLKNEEVKAKVKEEVKEKKKDDKPAISPKHKEEEKKGKLLHEEIEMKREKEEEMKMNKNFVSKHSSRITESKAVSTTSEIIKGRTKRSLKEHILKIYRTKWFSIFMLVITAWTMLSEDFRYLAPQAIDPLFYTIIII